MDHRHEAHGAEVFTDELAAMLSMALEALIARLRPDRHHEQAALGELRDERLGQVVGRGSDDDAIVGCALR